MELNVRRCDYCGAPLSAAYYFCRNCSQPYTKVEFVLPKVSVPYLSDGAKVKQIAPGALRIFWLYVSIILGTGIIGAALFGLESSSYAFELFASFVFGAVTLGLAIYHFDTLKPQLSRPGFGNVAAWLAFPLLLVLLAVNYVYHVAFIEFLGLTEVFKPEESYTQIFRSYPAAVFFVAVLPAVTEEIADRGLIQEWLQKAVSPWKAIVFTSFLFGISHFSVYSLPYLFTVGLLLGWLKWRTGSLYPSILIHFLHNWAVITWME